MNKNTSTPLTPEELKELRRAWQRLSPEQRQAIRKLLIVLDGSQVKSVDRNILSDALIRGKS